jgi:hypothetical protein
MHSVFNLICAGTFRVAIRLALLCGCISVASAAPPDQGGDPSPSWGAIASRSGWYGYSFNHTSRSAAERAARAQCDRAAGRAGPCDVRVYFDRSCGALATGNYGEWGTGIASTANAARQAAVAQCDGHLPTEPCKVVVSVCSPG